MFFHKATMTASDEMEAAYANLVPPSGLYGPWVRRATLRAAYVRGLCLSMYARGPCCMSVARVACLWPTYLLGNTVPTWLRPWRLRQPSTPPLHRHLPYPTMFITLIVCGAAHAMQPPHSRVRLQCHPQAMTGNPTILFKIPQAFCLKHLFKIEDLFCYLLCGLHCSADGGGALPSEPN